MAKTMSLKQVLSAMGAQNVQIKNAKVNGQNRAEWSGFFTLEGQAYYISTSWGNDAYSMEFKRAVPLEDVYGGMYQDGALAKVMYRTALDYKDTSGRGGVNRWDFGNFAVKHGVPQDVRLSIW